MCRVPRLTGRPQHVCCAPAQGSGKQRARLDGSSAPPARLSSPASPHCRGLEGGTGQAPPGFPLLGTGDVWAGAVCRGDRWNCACAVSPGLPGFSAPHASHSCGAREGRGPLLHPQERGWERSRGLAWSQLPCSRAAGQSEPMRLPAGRSACSTTPRPAGTSRLRLWRGTAVLRTLGTQPHPAARAASRWVLCMSHFLAAPRL